MADTTCEESALYVLSSASITSVEDVARANGDGQRWYQLFWLSRDHDEITISMLNRVKATGYTAVFVTLDTYILGWRPFDMDNGYNPFLGPGQVSVAIGFSDPVSKKKFKEKHGCVLSFQGLAIHGRYQVSAAALECTNCAEGNPDRGRCKPCCLGRGSSSLGMFPHIVDAVGGETTIFLDSGVTSGADIAKALALGAQCVLIGRPYLYRVVLDGCDGVVHILR
ncbi:hypothetical protein B0J11DRAFT_503502 [Dendryphion nanum]|uniref:FMN hydroxy acid dehydrogenase domain-containing protein n=1 Tax=Dendryphion nanum TaxID=256645 RepID=A0A9P9E5K6_9PLEO|nr:hypothetical protein B0J11DRAFT_503502 [Dendryphion nanum]